MREEHRVWGPPGTGKTTYIADEVSKDIEIYGPDQVSICSLTNTAVREIKSRGIPIDLDNVTTLHARCKRALNAPPPAESRIKDFRSDCGYRYANPRCIPLSSEILSREDAILSRGKTLYDMAQINRQRMIPIRLWDEAVRKWYDVWSRWCLDNGLMDYTSWLEAIIEAKDLPSQSVVYVDEAQDHTPLQLAAIRSWDTRKLVLVGDDDQAIYEWCGSVPEEFLRSHSSSVQERVLGQSYRVPRSIHRMALDISSHITNRREKEYRPTDSEGHILYSNFSLAFTRERLIPNIDDGSERMILASCSYMLDGIVRHLIEAGIPFHNPYRKANRRWNPLDSEQAVAARSYLLDKWTGSSILNWVDQMKPEAFSDIERLKSLCHENLNREVRRSEILPYIAPRSSETLLSRNGAALLQWVSSGSLMWNYYIRALSKPLRVIVGTIHSVKGGEADIVHIFPDISSSSWFSALRDPDRLNRLFYVAVTRARDTIVLHDTSRRDHFRYPMGERSCDGI